MPNNPNEEAWTTDVRWEGPNQVAVEISDASRRITYYERPNSRELRFHPHEGEHGSVSANLVDTEKSGAWNVIGMHVVLPREGLRETLQMFIKGETVAKYELAGKERDLTPESLDVLNQLRDEMVSRAYRLIKKFQVKEKIAAFRNQFHRKEDDPWTSERTLEWWKRIVRDI